MDQFDNRMRGARLFGDGDSSSEEEASGPRRPATQLEVEKQKNSILMDKLFRAEKQVQDLKDTYEAVTTSYDDIKDKKIIELAKQKRNLLLQIESLRTKAAKAAEAALRFKKQLEGQGTDEQGSPQPRNTP